MSKQNGALDIGPVLLVALLAIVSTQASMAATVVEDSTDLTLYYTTTMILPLYEIKLNIVGDASKLLDRGLKLAVDRPLLIKSHRVVQDPHDAEMYYQVKVFDFPKNNDQTCPAMRSGYIGCDDNAKTYVIRATDFDSRVEKGQLVKQHNLSYLPTFRFGTAISLPFKLRRQTSKHPRVITTDASLGGYLALRWRVNSKRDFFVNAVASAGLSLLPVGATQQTETGTDTSANTTRTSNTVPGITWSGGMVVELDSFQIGVLSGRDYASGEAGRLWAYNTEQWYALSIGYTFFGTGSDEPIAKKAQTK